MKPFRLPRSAARQIPMASAAAVPSSSSEALDNGNPLSSEIIV